MTPYELVKIAHAVIGAAALVTFWTAGMARKGSPLHVGAGRVYLVLMAAIVLSGIPLAVQRFISNGVGAGLFFLHLVVLVAVASFVAWRAIRDKRDWRRFAGPAYQAFAWLTLATGAAITVVGATRGNGIFIAFGLLGVKIWWDMFRFARNGPDAPNWWLSQHYRGMIGNGIATHIAFVLIGLPKLVPAIKGGVLLYVGWLLPLAVGLGLQAYLDRRHRPRTPVQQRVAA